MQGCVQYTVAAPSLYLAKICEPLNQITRNFVWSLNKGMQFIAVIAVKCIFEMAAIKKSNIGERNTKIIYNPMWLCICSTRGFGRASAIFIKWFGRRAVIFKKIVVIYHFYDTFLL